MHRCGWTTGNGRGELLVGAGWCWVARVWEEARQEKKDSSSPRRCRRCTCKMQATTILPLMGRQRRDTRRNRGKRKQAQTKVDKSSCWSGSGEGAQVLAKVEVSKLKPRNQSTQATKGGRRTVTVRGLDQRALDSEAVSRFQKVVRQTQHHCGRQHNNRAQLGNGRADK